VSAPIVFKLLVEHDFDPDDSWDYHQWVDLGPPPPVLPSVQARCYGDEPYEVALDAIGRRHPHGYTRWRLLICNNPDCSGRARYRLDAIEQMASEWDRERLGVCDG